MAGVAEMILQGALHGHNRKTLGDDYAERLAALRSRLASEAQEREIKATGLAKMKRDSAMGERVEELQALNTEGLGGDSPSDVGPTQVTLDKPELIARLRAKRAAEAAGLETRKAEADIELTEANAAKAEAVPDQKLQEMELKRQQLQAAHDRAVDAGQRAQLGLELKALQLQMSQTQFESREGRLERMFADRNHLGQGLSDRMLGLSTSLRQLGKIQSAIADPAAQSLFGPLKGRTVAAAMQYLGGAGVSPKERELQILLEGALSQEAFENGGKQLTGGELERFRKTAIAASDTLETALQKLAIRGEILNGRFDDLVSILSPAQANQAGSFVERARGAQGPGASAQTPPASLDGPASGTTQGGTGATAGAPAVPPGYKLQRNRRTGETRVVPR